MTTATATEAKTRLGEYMEMAQREPVQIRKGRRNYAVLISQEDFERFQALEDRYWSEKAAQGAAGGYLSPDETMAFINSRLREG